MRGANRLLATLLIQVEPDALRTGNQNFACIDVNETAFACACDGLRTISFRNAGRR